MFIHFLIALALAQSSTTTSSAPSSDCKFHANGKVYDLSTMNSPIPSSDGISSMGRCGNNAEPCGTSRTGFLTQFYGSSHYTCNAVIAKWDGSHTVGSLTTQGSTDGFSLSFANGDPCDSTPRKLTVNYICDQTATTVSSFTMSEPKTCEYTITVNSIHGCGAVEANESTGLSGGWIFIIILICVSFVYCVGGALYNFRYQDKAGMEMVPNLDFWSKVPTWTRVGCDVSWNFVRNLYYDKCSSGGGSDNGRKFSSMGV